MGSGSTEIRRLLVMLEALDRRVDKLEREVAALSDAALRLAATEVPAAATPPVEPRLGDGPAEAFKGAPQCVEGRNAGRRRGTEKPAAERVTAARARPRPTDGETRTPRPTDGETRTPRPKGA